MQVLTILSSTWFLDCPKKSQKIAVFYWMCDSIKFSMKNYLHVQTCCLFGLLLTGWTILDSFWPTFDLQGVQKELKIVIYAK